MLNKAGSPSVVGPGFDSLCCSTGVCAPTRVPVQWFYENKPLQYSKLVNGPSYKRWKLPLPVMSTLYRLAGQVHHTRAAVPSAET